MNKIRVYTDLEIKKLLKNQNVDYIKNKSQIKYSDKFKLWAVKEKLNNPEKTARQIFEEGEFDMEILDERTPQKRLSDWVKKYKKFGETYFLGNSKYSYQSKHKGISNDPDLISFIFDKQEDGSFNCFLVKRKKDEKTNC
ncbi:MAG: hypothetical protein Q4G04_00525 [bacterium]|nr:hypothetical protein [bacterium]